MRRSYSAAICPESLCPTTSSLCTVEESILWLAPCTLLFKAQLPSASEVSPLRRKDVRRGTFPLPTTVCPLCVDWPFQVQNTEGKKKKRGRCCPFWPACTMTPQRPSVNVHPQLCFGSIFASLMFSFYLTWGERTAPLRLKSTVVFYAIVSRMLWRDWMMPRPNDLWESSLFSLLGADAQAEKNTDGNMSCLRCYKASTELLFSTVYCVFQQYIQFTLTFVFFTWLEQTNLHFLGDFSTSCETETSDWCGDPHRGTAEKSFKPFTT